MSSSDDDDCYGNIAQRLQSMKQTYKPTILPANIEDDDNAIVEGFVEGEDGELSLSILLEKESLKMRLQANDEDPQPSTTSSKRVTRRSLRTKAKKSEQPNTVTSTPTKNNQAPTSPARSPIRWRAATNGRRRGRGRVSRSTIDIQMPVFSIDMLRETAATNGRRRGRGQVSRSTIDSQMPVFSIGNTHEYPDASDGIELFDTQIAPGSLINIPDEDLVNTSLDDNEEISVKIFWKSTEYFKFTIRKFQKLSQIFDFFSQREGIRKDQLLFTLGDRVLTSEDTPDSIDYSICKFIEGGVVHYGVTHLTKQNSEKSTKPSTGLQLKFQCQQRKKPFITNVDIDQKLHLAMVKCAEDLEVPYSKLKFYFDGDLIDSTSTPNQLELEGGECIDVRILS